MFVSNFWDVAPSGAYNLTHSHYESLSSITGGGGSIISTLFKDDTEKPEAGKISIRCSRNIVDSMRNRLHGKVYYYSNEAEDKILDAVREGKYSFVFMDQFIYGSAVKKIKQEFPDLPVLVFYHSVTGNFLDSMRRIPFSLKYPLRVWDYLNYRRHERLSAEYADASIILNERDGSIFRKRYGREPELYLPMCLIDTAHIAEVRKKDDEFNILFVGGARHSPNLDGIKWFAVNVMPHLDSRVVLHLVGTSMDEFRDAKEFRDNDRIRLTGRVESLDDFYNMADLVVAPIFYGNGMMTKVAEAMMYGKNFLASRHAINGYDGFDECVCDTSEDFIRKINGLIASGPERYNPAMRKVYEERYSIEAMAGMLRKLLTDKHII